MNAGVDGAPIRHNDALQHCVAMEFFAGGRGRFLARKSPPANSFSDSRTLGLLPHSAQSRDRLRARSEGPGRDRDQIRKGLIPQKKLFSVTPGMGMRGTLENYGKTVGY